MIQLMVCVNQRWQLLCGDVRAAFLSGEKFDRDIIVVPDCAALLGQRPDPHAPQQVGLRSGRRTPPMVD